MADTTYSKSTIPTRAILAFTVGCVMFTYAFVQRVAPSVMVGDLMDAFSVSAAALGGLAAWYFYAYASIQLPVGILIDKFGPRPLFTLSMLLCAGGSILFGQAESLEIAALGRFIIGGTVAFAYVGTVTIAARMFPASNLPIAIGILQFLGMSGAVAGQAPLAHMISILGWRESMTVFAIVALILAAAAYAIIPTMKPVIHDDGKKSSAFAVLKNPQTWLASAIGFACAAPMLAFAGLWAVPWLQDIHNLSHTAAAATASAGFAGWGIGSALAGPLYKKAKNRKAIVIACMAFMLADLAFLLYAPELLGITFSQTTLMVLLFLFGLVDGPMIIGFIFARENNAPENAGTALGTINMCVVGSGAVMQPMIGYLLDSNWAGISDETGRRIFSHDAYTVGFSSLLIILAIGITAAFFARDQRPN